MQFVVNICLLKICVHLLKSFFNLRKKIIREFVAIFSRKELVKICELRDKHFSKFDKRNFLNEHKFKKPYFSSGRQMDRS